MQLQERLNRLGVCLSHGRRDVLLKLLGGHFADKVVECVKSGSVFRGTGDNWDLKVLKGHMRKDIQNEDLHLFASNLIENRVNFAHLPNDHPKADIVCFPRHKFSLANGKCMQILRKYLLGESYVNSCPNSSGSSQCYLPTFLTGTLKKWQRSQPL